MLLVKNLAFISIFSFMTMNSLCTRMVLIVDYLFAFTSFSLYLIHRSNPKDLWSPPWNTESYCLLGSFGILKFFVVGAENIRPTGKPQEKIIKSVEIDKRNRIVEMLGKFACVHTPYLRLYVASSGMWQKILFLKKMLPLCFNKTNSPYFFIACHCTLCLLLAVSTSLANKIYWRLSAR